MMTWAAALLGLALLFFVLEIFIPSGGALGLAAAACLIGGVGCLFAIDFTYGMVGVIGVLLAMPFGLAAALRMFPHTPIGRLLTLSDAQSSSKTMQYDPARDEKPDELVGATGEAISGLRPVGICKINNRKIECLSESGVIEPGTKVKVIAVNGIEVKVRAI